MAKRPENMTPDERLTRIRSLERKVRQLEHDNMWAEREREGTLKWGQSAFAENRRLTDRLHELIERIPSLIAPELQAADGTCPHGLHFNGRYCDECAEAREGVK